ncbi:hypothetical protein Tsubulata_018056 [Turnera subulata]|uniref:F-box domain-containing protein n=1 Tax=Turnera subulata TaxID=218843 RepID=A0A9Q0IZQ0_9ROSI|nr:hypothetical protein Tsubulata_018056 [Turnera subulata]
MPRRPKRCTRENKRNLCTRNWVELPRDVTASILHRLGGVEIIETAQKVCTTWRSICKEPSMWSSIDMHNTGEFFDMPYSLVKMCQHAVDRSSGGLQRINIEFFGTDELLQYIVERSSNLKSLRLVMCYDISDEGLVMSAKKMPSLEELELYSCYNTVTGQSIEAVGRSCPLLKSLTLNREAVTRSNWQFDDDDEGFDLDEEAMAIGKSMPGLRHLMIFGNLLTNDGLKAILDGCPHLESLDLRKCFNLKLEEGGLGRRCAERIKVLLLPNDSTAGYPFDVDLTNDCGSTDSSDWYGRLTPPLLDVNNELPRNVTASILHRLGAIEILETGQKVCTTWRSICKEPSMWRSIDMRNLGDLHGMPYCLVKMCRHAVERSSGDRQRINIEYFGTDELLEYIVDRSCSLKSLRLVICYDISDEGLIYAAKKMPLLQELELYYCKNAVSKDSIEVVGRSCPLLKSLTLNQEGIICSNWEEDDDIELDGEAIAIAKSMPELRHLKIFGNLLTNDGLKAILDGCPHLESLDLRQCFNLKLEEGGLGRRCAERIKVLLLPNDSTVGYPFDATLQSFSALDGVVTVKRDRPIVSLVIPPPPPRQEQPELGTRNWLELPRDVTASILHRLGGVEILETAQKVCTTWRSICKEPSMWRSVDMHILLGDLDRLPSSLEKMCRHAVNRSSGDLQHINIEFSAPMNSSSTSSSSLKSLRLVFCRGISDEGLIYAAEKMPLLEELEFHYCYNAVSRDSIEVIGRSCPLLKSFTLNRVGVMCSNWDSDVDEEAMAIGKSMPGLRHLKIFGNLLRNDGLQAILDGCAHLESLDLRQCFNLKLQEGGLERRCAERIKILQHRHHLRRLRAFETGRSYRRTLGPIEIITSAQYVCSAWRRLCRDDPSLWRSIHLRDPYYYEEDDAVPGVTYDLEKICRHAVDRSSGALHDIVIHHFASDNLLRYISDRCVNLKILRLVYCSGVSDECLSVTAPNFRFLEELELSYCGFRSETIEQIGRSLPLLLSFKLNATCYTRLPIVCDDEAFAIAKSMPSLRRLQLFGNKLTNDGLLAILDSCHRLESLDLRHCFNVNLNDRELERRGIGRIKELRAPNDSTADYPFNQEIHDLVSSEEDYPSGISDVDLMSDDDDGFYEFSGGSDMSDYEALYFD